MANNSKIQICNTALSLIGENVIRSFDEENSRARLADRMYDTVQMYVLSLFDWPFARAFRQLNRLDPAAIQDVFYGSMPQGMHAYALPSDCAVPRDLHPRGTNIPWTVIGEALATPATDNVHLHYTRKEVNPARFSDTYINAVVELLASRLANPLKQDKALAKDLFNTFQMNLQNSMAVDANIGSEYRFPDEDPDNDSFVDPDRQLGFASYGQSYISEDD